MPSRPPRIWFASGYWWFGRPIAKEPLVISGLIVECRFKGDEIATRISVPVRSFHRLVSDSLGLSPGEWLRQLRAVEARMRIRDGDPIKLISHDLGFGRQTDFAREFKLWYGVSPDAFRQNFQSQIDRIRDTDQMRS